MYMWSVLQFGLLTQLQNVKNTCCQPAALLEITPSFRVFFTFYNGTNGSKS